MVVDWAYEPTLDHVSELIRRAAETGSRDDLERFCFTVGLEVLERAGFTPLTRPSLLRLGFRDVCLDLDLHDATSVRVVQEGGRILRIHMDYDGNALVVQTPTAARDEELEELLAAAYPLSDVRRLVTSSPAAVGGYQVRFSLPQSMQEVREEMAHIRRGLIRILFRFEPRRLRDVESQLATFGERETLARVRPRESQPVGERIPAGARRPGTVH